MAIAEWDNRPIEDKLRAENERIRKILKEDRLEASKLRASMWVKIEKAKKLFIRYETKMWNKEDYGKWNADRIAFLKELNK